MRGLSENADEIMKKHFIQDGYDKPIVLALGFFDCIHNGHKALIEEAKRTAARLKAETALITFANDPNVQLKKKEQIYTFFERSSALENLGLQNLIYTYFNDGFLHYSAAEFLELMTSRFDIKAVVAGRDYRFGYGAEGNVDYLKRFMSEKGIKVKIVPYEKNYEKKISTTSLKKLVTEGNVSMLNTCLSEPYFLIGNIIHAKHRGSIIGYPTANLSVHDDCMKIAGGIYATIMYIDGKPYYGATNVGPKPTFGEDDYTIETYLLDFNRSIYGKEVKLVFYKKIRGVIKFNTISALVRQLNNDEKEVRKFFGLEIKE